MSIPLRSVTHANILSSAQIQQLLAYVRTTAQPLRNEAIIRLGLAGFSSQDIAALRWADLDAGTTKYSIPSDLQDVLHRLRVHTQTYRGRDARYVIRFRKANTSIKSRAMSVRFLMTGKGDQQGWFQKLGFESVSSHSLRRTYLATQPVTLHRRSSTMEHRTICFQYHEHACIVCGESLVVDVHHRDRNPRNNAPENLIPLCPTHHRYCHRRHLRARIEPKISAYLRRKSWNDAGKPSPEESLSG